ncbi:DUF3103 family protein, partial [Salinivibrio costicola]
MNKKILISLLFAGLSQVFTPAFAGSADNNVVEIKRDTAKQLSQDYAQIAPTLQRNINSYGLNAPLSALTQPQARSSRSKRSLDAQLHSADRALREAQGVEDVADQLLEVRLAVSGHFSPHSDNHDDLILIWLLHYRSDIMTRED